MHHFSSKEIGEVLYPWGEIVELEARPFERGLRVEQYRSAMPRRASKRWGWREERFSADFVGVRGVLTLEEARFWFAVGTDPSRLDDTSKESSSEEAVFDFADDASLVAAFAGWIERFVERCGDLQVVNQAWLARVLCDLLPAGRALDAVLRHVPERAVPTFLEHLLPPLPDELDAYRSAGSGYLEHLDYMDGRVKVVVRERRKAIGQRLSPMLKHGGATDRLLDLLERDPPASRSNAVMHLIQAVEDDEEFLERLKSRVKEWGRREVVLLIGRMGEDGLQVVRDAVVRRGRDASEGLANALELVEHPTAAEILLHLAQNPASGVVAREKLMEGNPAHVAGLLQIAEGRSRYAEDAQAMLQELRRTSPKVLEKAARERADVDADIIEAAAPELDSVDLPELPRADWPVWLLEITPDRKPRGLPRFLTSEFLPVFVLEGGEFVLPRRATWALMAAARDLDAEPDPDGGVVRNGRSVLEQFAKLLDEESLTYGFRLIFARWNQEGCPEKHDWCLRVMGLFGDDSFVLELTKWTDEWPKHDLKDVAELGVDVLAEIGTDAALMALNGITQRGTFAGVRRWATRRLDRLAAQRGLGPEELRDLVVDDCGLDDRGTMTFDYGARRFELVFDTDLRPRFRDEAGKIYRSLPRGRKSDDVAKVRASKARYKLVKKRLSEVLKTQKQRLEEALIDGRRWKAGAWRLTQVEHPLLTHLVQRFIWGTYGSGGLEQTFRVDESRQLVDVEDASVPFEELGGREIGLVHPLELSETEKLSWANLLGDYEVVPPFPQLNREVYWADGAELAAGLTETEVSPGALRGQMKRFGWKMGYPGDDGRTRFYSRRFARGDLFCWLTISPGLNAQDWRLDQPQKLVGLGFTPTRGRRGGDGDYLDSALVDSIAWSEARRMASAIFEA